MTPLRHERRPHQLRRTKLEPCSTLATPSPSRRRPWCLTLRPGFPCRRQPPPAKRAAVLVEMGHLAHRQAHLGRASMSRVRTMDGAPSGAVREERRRPELRELRDAMDRARALYAESGRCRPITRSYRVGGRSRRDSESGRRVSTQARSPSLDHSTGSSLGALGGTRQPTRAGSGPPHPPPM